MFIIGVGMFIIGVGMVMLHTLPVMLLVLNTKQTQRSCVCVYRESSIFLALTYPLAYCIFNHTSFLHFIYK